MASALEREATTRRWRRVEYERLVDLGVFVGEHLELLDGVLVVREPQGSPHAAIATKVGRVLAAAFGGGWHTRLHSPLALGEHSEPEPDVAVVAGEPEDYIVFLGDLEFDVAVVADRERDQVGPAADGTVLGESLPAAAARSTKPSFSSPQNAHAYDTGRRPAFTRPGSVAPPLRRA